MRAAKPSATQHRVEKMKFGKDIRPPARLRLPARFVSARLRRYPPGMRQDAVVPGRFAGAGPLAILLAATLLGGCRSRIPSEQTRAQSDAAQDAPLAADEGLFTVVVSNQSAAITPVDIHIEVDGRQIVHEDIPVRDHHTQPAFGCADC
jgi:hypothetical protein